jgi:beta-lactamase regulating signal transducer with metallopeptidase domain
MKNAEELLLTFLLNALWQVPVVAGAAALGAMLIRRGPARLHYFLWLLAIVAGLALPAASLLPARSAPVQAAGGQTANVASVPAPAGPFDLSWLGTAGLPAARTARWPSGLAAAAAALYAAAVLWAALRLAASWLATRRLARRAGPAVEPDDFRDLPALCRAAFGLGPVALLSSKEIAGPVTFGVRRPTILLPTNFFAVTSRSEWTAALGHEMAHIARRDYLFNLLAELTLLPLSLHPAARFLRRRLGEAREMACDEATIEKLLSARVYARSLLAMAASFAGLPRPTYTLGVFDAGTLEVRMKRMTDGQPRMGARRARIHLSLAALLLLALSLGASGLALKAVAGERTAGGAEPPKEWAPFLGKWIGTVPIEGVREPDGSVTPVKKDEHPHFADLEVQWAGGAPQAILTLILVRNTPRGIEEEPIPRPTVSVNARGKVLTFRTHQPRFPLPGGGVTSVDADWAFELTGPNQGQLRMLWNSYYSPARARGESVPPKPPTLDMRKAD